MPEILDTVERIRQLDKVAFDRCKGATFKKREERRYRKTGKTCWWPGCDSLVHSYGLCIKHHKQFKEGKLLFCDLKGYHLADKAEMFLEFVEFANEQQISPEELLEHGFMEIIKQIRRKRNGTVCGIKQSE